MKNGKALEWLFTAGILAMAVIAIYSAWSKIGVPLPMLKY